MSDIQITREDNATGGRYVAVVNGEEAEMTYSRAGRDADHYRSYRRARFNARSRCRKTPGRSGGQRRAQRGVQNYSALPVCESDSG
jgi:hypothetical protein